MPRIGVRDLVFEHRSPARFYRVGEIERPPTPLEAAVLERLPDLILLAIFVTLLALLLWRYQQAIAAMRRFSEWRLALLLVMTVFIGWYGQGQLSVVTVLGTLRALVSTQNLVFLLYDPFSLIIWGCVLLSFLYWGRGFFCGWLCPYGALQEFTGYVARRLRIRQWQIGQSSDRWLKKIKYLILLLLVVMSFYAPDALDIAVEVEPFKTAITTYFIREWYFVVYALLWLLLGLVLFRGFCRYVCPLGAFMALGGLLRLRNWIPRRAECGSRCQLCAVRCQYDAIEASGRIAYDECFQCLDCVTLYRDADTCPPLVLAKKGRTLEIPVTAVAANAR